MKKVNISIPFDDDKLDALEFSLRKENSSVQKRMEESLEALYEKAVPKALREYVESRTAPAAKPRAAAPKPSAPDERQKEEQHHEQ